MAFFPRTCLLALVLSLVLAGPAAAGPRVVTQRTLPGVASPARLPGSIPLTPRPDAARPGPTLGQRAVAIAARELGVPYRYGGSGPGGFDCSGLTSWVFGRLGIALPHNAAAQFAYGRPVDRRHLRAGDLLFFDALGHVGIYIGHGRMIHAPQTGERVEIQSLSARSGELDGARRIV